MTWQIRGTLALMVVLAAEAGLQGQVPPPQPGAAQKGTDLRPGDLPPPQFKPEMPPPAADIVAATVNGQPIAELSIFRAAAVEERRNYDLLRKEILEHLIENALIDQYLLHQKINVAPKEIDEKMAVIKDEAAKKGVTLEKVLKDHFVTEAELRQELASMLRWDHFVIQQSSDEILRDFFAKNKNVFDGSQVHVRHILIKTEQGQTKEQIAAREQATARLLQLKKWMEEETQRELAKLPPEARNEKRSAEILETIFSEVAKKESGCSSKDKGGDLRWFLRSGMMVEPLARTAFALKTFEISDVVTTQFGCHLVMTVDRKPGKDVKYDDSIKVLVREVYSDRLRDAVVEAMRKNARIVLNPVGK